MGDVQEPQAPPAPAKATILPEELQGKSAEEIYAVLQEEHNRLLEEEKAKKGVKPQPPQPQQPPRFTPPPFTPPPEPEGFNPVRQEVNEVVDQALNARVAPLVANFVEAQRATNRSVFQQKIGKEWERWGEDIEKFVSGLAPQVQAHPNAYDVAYNYIRSLHVDELVKERAAEEAKTIARQVLKEMGIDGASIEQPQQQPMRQSLFNRGIPSVSGPRPFTPSQSAGSGLSSTEKRVAKDMNMTDEEYAAYKAMNNDALSLLQGGNK